ncbi:hypothetical protein EXS54_00815 [Patescibacteria group bacterium]|nr:hypothetical protein [Patescibacteria group bacterium]
MASDAESAGAEYPGYLRGHGFTLKEIEGLVAAGTAETALELADDISHSTDGEAADMLRRKFVSIESETVVDCLLAGDVERAEDAVDVFQRRIPRS